jgi:hypothetical protein
MLVGLQNKFNHFGESLHPTGIREFSMAVYKRLIGGTYVSIF